MIDDIFGKIFSESSKFVNEIWNNNYIFYFIIGLIIFIFVLIFLT